MAARPEGPALVAPARPGVADADAHDVPSLGFEADAQDESGPELNARSRYEILEHETGFEPATLTLAT